MVREIHVGTGQCLWDVGYGFPTTDVTAIINMNPSLYTGTLQNFCTVVGAPHAGGSIQFCTFTPTIGGNYIYFQQHDASDTVYISANPDTTFGVHDHVTLTGQSVDVSPGDYIGMHIHQNGTTESQRFKFGVWINYDEHVYNTDHYDENGYYLNDGTGEYKYWFPVPGDPTREERFMNLYGWGWESGGVSPDACQESGQIPFLNAYWGWGVIEFMDADCSFYPYLALVHVLTPWTEYITNEVLVQDIQKVYEKPGSNPKEYYGLTANLISCLETGALQLTECWWRESDIYYVKNGGSDSNLGVSWASAFATISKAATKVPAGGRAYIGFGTYNSETNITPTALGANPIRYYPCTPNSTGGTGSVVINL